MAQAGNAAAMREWLRTCPTIGRERRFGADYLGQEAGCCALSAAPGEAKLRENILGRVAPAERQSRDFVLAVRAPFGADAAGNLENLALLEDVADWIRARNAAGEFPQWRGGRVTGILPAGEPAPAEAGADGARYQLRIRVNYRID